MFKNIYPENIKLTMHWSDTQYETFVKDWEAIHLTYISEFRKSYILSDKSFELLLSLFFVSVQALKIPSTLDVKSALITILIFNVIYDDRVLNQTEKKCLSGDSPGPVASVEGRWPGPGRAAGFSRISG